MSDVGTAETGEADAVIRLLAIRDTPLSVDEVLAAVADPAAGGLVVFVGTVRDRDAGAQPADAAAVGAAADKAVAGLGYSAHPSAAVVLREVAERVARRHPVRALAAVHRVGELAVGELAVVVAASSPHRAEAFAAARQLIDDLKGEVPIWKHQRFADGTDEWVGLP